MQKAISLLSAIITKEKCALTDEKLKRQMKLKEYLKSWKIKNRVKFWLMSSKKKKCSSFCVVCKYYSECKDDFENGEIN